MTSHDFHTTQDALVEAYYAGTISYEEYTERYVALLELFEREDEV